MDRRIRWSINASIQFEETLKFWIKNNGNSTYSKFLLEETIKATNLLVNYPSIGRTTNDLSVRRILIDKNYAIYYSFNDSLIEIKLWRSLKMNPEQNKYED